NDRAEECTCIFGGSYRAVEATIFVKRRTFARPSLAAQLRCRRWVRPMFTNAPAVKQVPMQDERLSALDTAFLCLESAQAPLHLGAVAVFEPDRPIPPDRLVEVLGERTSQLPILRQRVRQSWLPPGAAVWKDDGRFPLERHIRQHRLDSDNPGANR